MEKPRLLYFADTMCSWCYGFAPQMDRLLAALGDRVELLLFSGGLRPYTTEPVDAAMRARLADAWTRIAALTGQPFGDGSVLGEGFVYDSEPASRAIVTLRYIAPGKDYPFMLAVQRAFYAGGEAITDPAVLARHAGALGVDTAAFAEAFASDQMKAATADDFRVAQRLGIDGFPTLVLHRQDRAGKEELVLIAKGYATAEDLLPRIEAALAGAAAMPSQPG